MMKKVICLLAVFIIPVLLASFTHALITLESPSAIYNYGDSLDVKAYLTSASSKQDFLSILLSCNGSEIEIYRSPVYLNGNEEKKINVPLILENSIISNNAGECFLKAFYGGEHVQSKEFEISSEINVVLTLSEIIVNPGEKIFIKGEAKKKNSQLLDGYIDINIVELNLSGKYPVNKGIFSVNLTLPSDARARDYQILIRVYEEDSAGNVANEGKSSISFTVPQIATYLDIAVGSSSLIPPNKLDYTPLLYDQSIELIQHVNIIVNLFDPFGNSLSQNLIESGVVRSEDIIFNATPGEWIIEAKQGNLRAEKKIYINGVENATFSLQDGTLTVINIGNVPYENVLETTIGSVIEVTNVYVPVSKSKKFNLKAPDGSYTVSLSEGSTSYDLGNVFLTGRAVKVSDSDSYLSDGVSPWVLWIFIFIGLIFIALYFYIKVVRRPYWGHTPESHNSNSAVPSRIAAMKTEGNNLNDDSGKREATIISLHLRNLAQLESVRDSNALGLISSLTGDIAGNKTSVYHQGSDRIIILTEKENNEISAIEKAHDIYQKLEEYNKKHALKINYGIGINKGTIIVEQSGDKSRYTAIGTTIVGAKKLAEKAQSCIYFSEDIHKYSIGKVKSEKAGEKYWKLLSIQRRGQHSEFIDKFMRRQG